MFEARALHRLQVGPIDLRLEAGTCTSLTGPSGAGKSVLLRMLADLDPHAGDAAFEGRSCAAMPAPEWRRVVTYVPADSGWWSPRVEAHFEPGREWRSLLPSIGMLPEAASWTVSRLSTGERQRLALLRAIGNQTRVLLLDEPTSGLDADNVARVEAFLDTHRSRGLALLWVTHDPAQARRVASRHLSMRDGRLVAVDPA